MWYLALFILAVWLSRASEGALLMTAVIGISWSLHLPLQYISDRNSWFTLVLFCDVFIILVAIFANVKSSVPIMGLSFMLCVGHLIDWRMNTDPIYYVIANYLEYLEIISCVVFSPIVLSFIRQKVRHAIRNT